MTTVRIYQPSKTAMQSGRGKTKEWRVDFETKDPLTPSPLMGWVSSQDTSQQLHLKFPSLEEALKYVQAHNIHYTVCTPPQVGLTPKKYDFNFTNPRLRG